MRQSVKLNLVKFNQIEEKIKQNQLQNRQKEKEKKKE